MNVDERINAHEGREIESLLRFAQREEAMTRSRGWTGIADDWVTLIKGYEKKIQETTVGGITYGQES